MCVFITSQSCKAANVTSDSGTTIVGRVEFASDPNIVVLQWADDVSLRVFPTLPNLNTVVLQGADNASPQAFPTSPVPNNYAQMCCLLQRLAGPSLRVANVMAYAPYKYSETVLGGQQRKTPVVELVALHSLVDQYVEVFVHQ